MKQLNKVGVVKLHMGRNLLCHTEVLKPEQPFVSTQHVQAFQFCINALKNSKTDVFYVPSTIIFTKRCQMNSRISVVE